MYNLKLGVTDQTPIYLKIVQNIVKDIEENNLRKNEQLPSLNVVKDMNGLSRYTVEKAYRILCKKGYISSVKGKGFYVNSPSFRKIKILLVFNKISTYKKLIYYSFIKSFGENAIIDLQVHHYKAQIFEEIISKNLDSYQYFVVIPLFFRKDEENAIKVLERIPPNQLYLLDKDLPNFKKISGAVFQDFKQDVFNSLKKAHTQISRYQNFVLVFSDEESYPSEILEGVRSYCNSVGKKLEVFGSLDDRGIFINTVFLVIEDSDLTELIKNSRLCNFKIGNDIGIISFNESILKELLEITVISTDFEQMGKASASLIIEGRSEKIKNSFFLIDRKSL